MQLKLLKIRKLVNTAKKSTIHALKIPGKRAIQKAAEARGDLVGNFIGY